MKKALLPLLYLLPVASQAQAPVYWAPTTHADSVTALRNLFRYQRRHTRERTLLAGAIIGLQPVGFLDKAANPASSRVIGLSVAALAACFLPAEISGWHRFSKRREEEAVQRFERHQPQPVYLQRAVATMYSAPLPTKKRP